MRNALVDWFHSEYQAGARVNQAEGSRRVVELVRHGLQNKKFTANDISYMGMGIAMGAIDPLDTEGSLEKLARYRTYFESRPHAELLSESNPGVATNAFQIVTGELIASQIIAGYEDDSDFIGDQLVTVMSNQRVRNQRIAGFTALGGPDTVDENMPYGETDFTEKYVTTEELKKGRILSLTMEFLLFDQTGEINRRANLLGYYIRQERERFIVDGVQDNLGSGKFVYRPSGTGEALYNVDGSNKNYIGAGNTTDTAYNAAVPLVDWTDVDTVLVYRATVVKDDRIDGTQEVIAGLNGPNNMLLVPYAKRATAARIVGASETRSTDGANETSLHPGSGVAGFVGDVKASALVDQVDVANWYYGDFKKQFIWTEILPMQVMVQGQGSEADFERDVWMRLKGRYYGGISATDTKWVTKVDGA